ncbi:hypothetical protein EMGBS15_11020 [Filimonas sp.]|nr:hypothetical protein EMGBS15_11020 [Filimonas sp.]
MADLSGYEKQKQSDEKVSKAIEDIMRMPREELADLMASLAKTIEEVTPLISEFTERIHDGDELTEEEMTTLIDFQDICQKASDFILLAKQALMNRMTAYADEVYYAIKAEAEKGNPEAQKSFEKLRLSRQKVIKAEMGDSSN